MYAKTLEDLKHTTRPRLEKPYKALDTDSGRLRIRIPPLPQYAFMVWCLTEHRDNFIFTLGIEDIWKYGVEKNILT